jgi:hypothetical protein
LLDADRIDRLAIQISANRMIILAASHTPVICTCSPTPHSGCWSLDVFWPTREATTSSLVFCLLTLSAFKGVRFSMRGVFFIKLCYKLELADSPPPLLPCPVDSHQHLPAASSCRVAERSPFCQRRLAYTDKHPSSSLNYHHPSSFLPTPSAVKEISSNDQRLEGGSGSAKEEFRLASGSFSSQPSGTSLPSPTPTLALVITIKSSLSRSVLVFPIRIPLPASPLPTNSPQFDSPAPLPFSYMMIGGIWL